MSTGNFNNISAQTEAFSPAGKLGAGQLAEAFAGHADGLGINNGLTVDPNAPGQNLV